MQLKSMQTLYSLSLCLYGFGGESAGTDPNSPTPFPIQVGDYVDPFQGEFVAADIGMTPGDLYRVTAIKHSFQRFETQLICHTQAVIVPVKAKDTVIPQ